MKTVDIHQIYTILKKEVQNYNVPVVDLVQIQTNDPFKVLIATILSARTKDETTVNACKKLFNQVKNIDDLKKLTVKQLEDLIFPVGFYKNKAKYLTQLPKALEKLYSNKIPHTVEELIKLPGVGRKTANLVVAVAFDRSAICVDVHVHVILNRLSYVKTNTPYKTEMALRKKLPKKYWTTINSILVAYGQEICRTSYPKCGKCVIEEYCSYNKKDLTRI